MKPLFIPLKTGPFRQFQNGTKPGMEELRIYGPRWNETTCTPGRPVILSHGYGKHERLHGIIESFKRCPVADLPRHQRAAVVAHYGVTRDDIAVIKIAIKDPDSQTAPAAGHAN